MVAVCESTEPATEMVDTAHNRTGTGTGSGAERAVITVTVKPFVDRHGLQNGFNQGSLRAPRGALPLFAFFLFFVASFAAELSALATRAAPQGVAEVCGHRLRQR